jgi:ribose transport system permease protein
MRRREGPLEPNDTPADAAGSESPAASVAVEPGPARLAGFRRHSRRFPDYAVFVAFAVVIAAYSVIIPETFFTTGNLQSIINSQAVLLLVTLGLVVPLVTGEFDLSIGSMLEFSAILLTFLIADQDWSTGTAIAVAVGAGAVVGVVNGFCVVWLGIGAFIATLATGTILVGGSLAISNGQIVTGVSEGLSSAVNAEFLGLQMPVFVAIGFAVLLWYVLEHTPVGRHLYFVGAGPDTARLAGLPIDRLRFGAFVVSGIVSALAGVLAAGSFGGSFPGFGASFLLPAYAAAFLGATAIKGGRFNSWGTVVALYFVVTGVTGLQLMGAQSWVNQVFNGVALLGAVAFARLSVSRRGY